MQNILVIVPTYKMNNVSDYIQATLDAILKQNVNEANIDLVVVDTLSSAVFRTNLSKWLLSCKVSLNFNGTIRIFGYNEPLPVFNAFNLAIYICKKNKDYNFVLYCADDVILTKSDDLSVILNTFKDSQACLVSARVDHDNVGHYFHYDLDEPYPLKIAIGENVNLHCMAFSEDYLNKYDYKYIDVISGWGSESMLPFVCAAIEKDWVICNKVKLYHSHQRKLKEKVRGPTSLNYCTYKGIKTYKEVLEPGVSVGIGFETFRANPLYIPGIQASVNKYHAKCKRKGKPINPNWCLPDFWCDYDKSCYDENGRSKTPEKLYEYIKEYLFLPKNIFNYEQESLKVDII